MGFISKYTFRMKHDSGLSRELKLKNKLILIILVLLLAQVIYNPERPWKILLVGLGGAFILSYFWARSLMNGLQFSREIRKGWAKVGDQLQERFEMVNDSRFPALWVTITDHSVFPGYLASTARAISQRGVQKWIKGAMCIQRGYYIFGDTDLETGDPFGFFSVRLHDPSVKSTLVMPPVVPLPSIQIATGDRRGDSGTKQFTFERTATAASVREYAYGDSLHSIHWLTSARRDDLYARVFDLTPASDWWLFLDVDQAVQVGEGLEATDEYGVVLAASIADRGLRHDRPVGLVSDGEEQVRLLPKIGAGQRGTLFRKLATLSRGETPLAQTLLNSQPYIPRHSSVIIITPSVSQDWVEVCLMLLNRHMKITLLLLDPEAFGGVGQAAPILARLKALGINTHRITPEIYNMPKLPERRVWRVSHSGLKDASFTAGDLDWGSF
jgi:uncharacterized protein (DUF58 family)